MKLKELIGKITFQENIDSIDKNKIDKTLVINVPNPLKSYYSRFTTIKKPTSVIFITQKPVSFEKILRATHKINKGNNWNLEGGKCEVTLGNKTISGLRVKGINRYTEIEGIQEKYKEENFEFAKEVKYENTEALIRVSRFFKIKEIEQGFYQSDTEENVYYLLFPKHISWNAFKSMTFDIKTSIIDNSYDIAKGLFYINGGVTEMFRVVKPNASIELLKTIRDKYVERLQ